MVQTAHFLQRVEASVFLSSRFFCKGKELAGKILFHEKVMQQATEVTLLSKLPQSI